MSCELLYTVAVLKVGTGLHCTLKHQVQIYRGIAKVPLFLGSCTILSSFKIVIIYSNTADFVLISADDIKNDHNFEKNEEHKTVF